MRGLTILAMAFVNDLADFAPVKDVPQWLKHMKAGLNGFTFVDMIIPIFMFILGMSIPLALGKRLAREGGSPVRVLGHVLMRGVSLIIIGLFDANRGAGLGRPYGDMLDWPHGLWKFLAWTFVFIVWLDIPLKSARAKNVHGLIRIAGLAGLVGLAVVFRNPSGGHFVIAKWSTLGQLGWAYLFASLTWLIFRNNRFGILGVFALFHCLYIGIKGGLFPDVWLVNWIGASILGTYSANAVAGLIIGVLLDRAVRPQGEDPRRAGAGPLCLHRRLSPSTGRRPPSPVDKLVPLFHELRLRRLGAPLLADRRQGMEKGLGPDPHRRPELPLPLPDVPLLDIYLLALRPDLLRGPGSQYRDGDRPGRRLYGLSRNDHGHRHEEAALPPRVSPPLS